MVTINSELLRSLCVAQLRHVHNMTDESGAFDGIDGIDAALNSDDCFDYLKAALGLGQALLIMQYDDDLAELGRMLDPTNDEFIGTNYATDGICNEVYAAFPENWEDVAYEGRN